jgi:C1A family cysteine protease
MHMRLKPIVIAAAFALGGLLGIGFGLQKAPPPAAAQAPPAQPKPVIKYARGHVAPPPAVLTKRHAEALKRNHRRLEALPKITAASYDCRTLGLVPPIEDQAQCGSCWDFSGTGVCDCAFIKGNYWKNDGKSSLSEQYTLDCGQNGGCNGDDNINVLDWCKTKGLPKDSDYGVQYAANPGRCRSTPSMKLWQIKDWGFCTPAQQQGIAETQDIKNALVAYGPVGTGVAAGSDWDGIGQNGTITGNSGNIDHDVIIVGWSDDHDNGDGSKGAWIMRNSWGTSWGGTCGWSGTAGGYAWVKYGADSIGSEACWASAVALPPPDPAGWGDR